MTGLEEIERLAKKHSSYRLIPPRTMSRKAQVWCARMRHHHSHDRLTQEQRARIEKIPGWSWSAVYRGKGVKYVYVHVKGVYVQVPGTTRWVKETV